MNDSLRVRIELVRGAIKAQFEGPRIDSVGQPCAAIPAPFWQLPQLTAFLKVADGAYCNGLHLFDAARLAEWGPHEWLPGGAEQWLTVGYNMDLPLVLNRRTEEVVELDADIQTEILRTYGSFDDVLDRAFSSRYREFSGMVLSELKHDTWYQLLCRLGFAEPD